MRITFHLGEDEVSRFEIASHVSGARPGGLKPREEARRCGRPGDAGGGRTGAQAPRLPGRREGEDASRRPDAPARESTEGG